MAKAKSKKSLIFRLALLAFSVYVVISLVVTQLNISKQKELLAAEQEKLQQQEYIKKEITSMLDSGENVEYLMKLARERLGFVFPDEEVYIDFDRK